MENSQIVLKEKLGLFGILKETIAILYRTPNFVILVLLTSLPLFCSLLPHEIFFQQTLIETAKIQLEGGSLNKRCSFDSEFGRLCVFRYVGPLELFKDTVAKLYGRYLLLGLSYLGIVHLLDLFTTIVIVNSASAIYAGESPLSLKERWEKSIRRMDNLKGPLITSIYALILSSLSLLGLISMVAHFYTSPSGFFEAFFWSFPFMAFFGLLSVAWLAKHMEWNAIWNMGVVISVLEEKKGTIAIGVSAYISRGCRRRGLFLMLIFFLWRLALRFSCLYVGWSGRGNGIGVTAAHVGLVCLGNVLKWVAFMVYFYDCKKRFLEKKVDVEQGSAAQPLK